MIRSKRMAASILLAFSVLCVQGNGALAADKAAARILESAEAIGRLSQKIAKAYFYRQQRIRVSHANRELKASTSALDREIKKLSAASLDDEEKNVLMFIAFTRDEMKEVISQAYTEENGALMLDFSDSLLEGSELIASKHTQKKDFKEAMLVTMKRNLFLLERITKYYIAFRAGFKDYNNIVQLKEAIQKFESNLKKINAFKGYPKKLNASVQKVNQFWPIAKRFYLGVEKGALPVIVLASTDNLIKELKKLETFHRNALVGGKG